MNEKKVRELIAKWRCYVCGEPIGDSFILFSLSVETDRVFLVHKKCQPRLDSEAILFGVQREVAALAESGAGQAFPDWICNHCGQRIAGGLGKPTICPNCGWNNWRQDDQPAKEKEVPDGK